MSYDRELLFCHSYEIVSSGQSLTFTAAIPFHRNLLSTDSYSGSIYILENNAVKAARMSQDFGSRGVVAATLLRDSLKLPWNHSSEPITRHCGVPSKQLKELFDAQPALEHKR